MSVRGKGRAGGADRGRIEGKRRERGRKPRADALRNRDRLVEAAKASFAASGADASLEEIALHAGVGIGTLYRHFPSRDAIVEAVYRREVEQLADAAERLAGSMKPGEALHAWMRLFVDYIATKRVIASALDSMVGGASELHASSGARITDAMSLLVARAKAPATFAPTSIPTISCAPSPGSPIQRRRRLGSKRAAPDRHPRGRTALTAPELTGPAAVAPVSHPRA